MTYPDLLFVPYQDSLDLLTVDDAMRICEEVYRMLARGTVEHSKPASFKLDVAEDFNNHWHVKAALLKEIPTTGVRLYNYYDDGKRNTVGALECARYVFLSDPHTGQGLAMVDEHWSYGIRSAAASTLACKWLAPDTPHVLGLVGIGAMGTNALRCLTTLFRFDEIRCTSRRRETREAFAQRWSSALGVPVRACDTVEEVVRGADLAVGGTTSSDVMTREEWLKPGSLFISLARRELDPDGWKRMDKIVLDSWDMNMRMPVFSSMVEKGQIAREQVYAEIQEVVAGSRAGRTSKDERILIHTTGLVAHDIALAHHVFVRAKEQGRGICLPAARPPE
jgi:ornithine cyclodeaminase/alanine dehydrogenase-like protein (mu-crystallin family)